MEGRKKKDKFFTITRGKDDLWQLRSDQTDQNNLIKIVKSGFTVKRHLPSVSHCLNISVARWLVCAFSNLSEQKIYDIYRKLQKTLLKRVHLCVFWCAFIPNQQKKTKKGLMWYLKQRKQKLFTVVNLYSTNQTCEHIVSFEGTRKCVQTFDCALAYCCVYARARTTTCVRTLCRSCVGINHNFL